jgi:CHAD domain-containing protein
MTTDDVLELEVALDVPDEWAVPPLPPDLVAEVRDGGTLDLDARYLDTPDHALLRRGVTLRRRTGGDDDGWHLKLPAGSGRDELRAPVDEATPDAVPERLLALVDGLRLGGDLVPVAQVLTRRTVRHVCSSDATVVADLVVDEVVGRPAEGAVRAWREVEVELVDGTPDLLDEVVAALVESGASRAQEGKLARALGRIAQEEAVPQTGAELVRQTLRRHTDRLIGLDPRVRLDDPDAVHQARVASRRLREALRTFRPLLDATVTEPLRGELRWWGGVLGEVRDAEVRRARVAAVLDALPDELALGPVRARTQDDLLGERERAHAAVIELMGSQRYRDLLARIDAIAADPPVVRHAERPAEEVAARAGRRAWRRLRRKADELAAVLNDASGSGPAPGPEGIVVGPVVDDVHLAEALHALRKSAKAARYAAQACEEVVGRPAHRFAKRAEAVQEAAGAHHDAVELAAALRAAGVAAHLAGESAFTFGLLVAAERARAGQAMTAFDAAWSALDRRKLRAWTH